MKTIDRVENRFCQQRVSLSIDIATQVHLIPTFALNNFCSDISANPCHAKFDLLRFR